MGRMSDGIECRFTCRRCAADKEPFLVRYRRTNEDIVEWVEGAVGPAMGAAHAKRSPLCMAQHVDLMLPIDEAGGGIGMKPRRD